MSPRTHAIDAADELIVEQKGAVRWITFNRPQARNAMTWNMYDRLVEACEEINSDRTVRAAVFTGAGGEAFVAGTDIAQFRVFKTEQDALDYEAKGNLVMSSVESVRVRSAPDSADSDLIIACYMSQDFHEGVESFLARRKPHWKGE